MLKNSNKFIERKLSVILSAHNEGEYIEKTINSFNKNNAPFELVVVCDACSDKTYEVAKKYTPNVYNVNFCNVSKVRNFGEEKASGNILVFGDADTVVSNNYLEEILKSITENDYGCTKWTSESGSMLGRYISWNTSIYNRNNIGGNFFVKKDIFTLVGGFDEEMKMGEDTDLGDRLRKIKAKHIFLKKCFIIPSERKFREKGYIYTIFKSWINGFLYKFFRNYYNNKIAK